MREGSAVAGLKNEVVRRYGAEPDQVRAVVSPYRICPLGAHVDHQLGPVTAMALDRGVILAYAPAGERRVRLSSLDFPGQVDFSLDSVPDRREGDWGNYARGAVRALQGRHALEQGIVGVTAGRLGEGGLSSSAAVGVAYLLALEQVNGLEIPPRENIALDQAVENGYLGLRNGILDQSAILLSRRGFLTHIQCRTAGYELIPRSERMPPFAILVAFSGLKQALVGTDYNRRVDECAAAARSLLDAAGRTGESPLLGRVTAEEYRTHRHSLTGPPAKRAAHFFSEVERVARGVDAWKTGDLQGFGALMTASGESSIRNYECGCEPLIDLYEILIGTCGVFGGRFSGAGFRGCCVALADREKAADAAGEVRRAYARRHPELAGDAPVLICETADGARIV